ncbi:GrpB family protein [Aneurinibacillus thermoaerophilus]|uniref:GrpB family protein n=1 Tax=Aneurinibacillus thermoaerophilus TaxID=143495 RepID=UPI002E208596|nr:GrpB family protein [Aneurinibacillus thermoaerophilus]MED0765255.1 GrpB family protein [Aneurinibacillus thermoaerophilus]
MRKVEVVPYNEKWPELFQEEANKIKSVFGDEAINIYHIGSTAIPHIHAKPIIDILVEVKDVDKVDSFNDEMEQLGYKPKGENGIAYRRYFTKGGNNRTHHVHVFKTGSEHITRHLAFRDYLITHKDEANTYSELKQKLSKQFTYNAEKYTQGKDWFIKEIQANALKWWKNQT